MARCRAGVVGEWHHTGGTRALLIAALSLTGLFAAGTGHAQGWGFAAEIGSILGTDGGTPFVFRVTPARSIAEEFSVAGSFYLSPGGSSKMYSGAILAQFHVSTQSIGVTPFFGVGAAHLNSTVGNDTAIMFPLGLSGDYPVGDTLHLVATASFNLHALTIAGEDQSSSLGLTVGMRFKP